MAKRTATEAPSGGDPQVPPVTDAPASQAGQAAVDPGQTQGATQVPPVTDVSAADPVPPSPPRVHPALAVTARRAMRRGGYTWPAGVTAVEADGLSRDEFAALDDDSNFKVDFV